MLQYRTTYVNGTPIEFNASSNATLDQQLRMVEVAYVGGDGADLEFVEANYSIWPSEGILYLLCTSYMHCVS